MNNTSGLGLLTKNINNDLETLKKAIQAENDKKEEELSVETYRDIKEKITSVEYNLNELEKLKSKSQSENDKKMINIKQSNLNNEFISVKSEFYKLESKRNMINKTHNFTEYLDTFEGQQEAKKNQLQNKITHVNRNLKEVKEKSDEMAGLLANQTHTFHNIYRGNEENYQEICKADSTISSLERKRICKVILLHCIAILLFFAIILVLLYKLFLR